MAKRGSSRRALRGPVLCALLVALGLLGGRSGYAQSVVDPEHGVIMVARTLRGLGRVKRVLIIGAHPDDEDTSLLTVLERGMGAEAAYLSLNRGEGGQNLIGPELGVGLGLIRSEELLSARRLDGAEQYFSRAYDFGYSKSADESFSFWPRDSLLADVVLVIRRFRPQVVVSIFSGTPRDGHGQHQVAGILAREAYSAAGDPKRFPEQLAAGLQPWTPLKLYRSTRFDREATSLQVATGSLDPLYGRSYHQIAMAGRSQHRSQDMGRIEGLGPRVTSLRLIESRLAPVSGPETSLFDGVDTTLTGLAEELSDPELQREMLADLRAYERALNSARSQLTQWQPSRIVPQLAAALAALRRASSRASLAGAAAYDLKFALVSQETKLESALLAAAGIVVEAFADDDLITPGQVVEVEVQIWNGGSSPLTIEKIALEPGTVTPPPTWHIEASEVASASVASGEMVRQRFTVHVPANAPPSQPYFLREPRDGAVYRWPDDLTLRAQPFDPALLRAEVTVTLEGESVARSVDAVYRFADQARGEVRKPLLVVPAVSVEIAPVMKVWPLGRVEPAAFNVTVRGEAPGGVEGIIKLEAPPGWRAAADELTFRLSGPGAVTTMELALEPPVDLEPGSYRFQAVVETASGRRYATGYSMIDYPHIRRQVLFRDARSRIEAFELERPARPPRVAYIPGAGDAIADAMRAMKLQVDVLDDRAIAAADLSAYDAIVVGVRAYETNQALLENNERLLDWVRAGGTLIVQYQQYRFFNGDYAPLKMSARFPHDRVSDETAAVRLLDPGHPVFSAPNRISEEDFDAWVQERGLYFPYEWDDAYTPLLEMADPGEAPKLGALLIAPLGDGLYIYTGLSLFRQIPAGVPGAYRLLMNLVSVRR